MTHASGASTTWILPFDALRVAYEEMATDGRRGCEGIALWSGTRTDSRPSEVTVSRVILLRGPGIRRARGFIQITPELLNEVTDALFERNDGSYLIGQIHGHPPNSSTDLSPTDVEFGIRTPDYLSIVAPSFGMGGVNIMACGVHVFDKDIGWYRIRQREIGARIIVNRQSVLEVCTIGTLALQIDASGRWIGS